jgi:transposase
MNKELNIITERVDDIPLLIGLMIRIHLPDIIDKNLVRHGHHKGLSNGWLITIWLAYILSVADHRKSHVRAWCDQHKHALERLVGHAIRDVDFTDDRLGAVLTRLSRPEKWEAIETELWWNATKVYAVEVKGVRLDSTSSYGYHEIKEDGVMQLGYSKDHRPDLPQLKLMAAVTEPDGFMIASEVYPGQRADDLLYLPIIDRVRRILNRTGLLYTGDSKMAALTTRAELVARGDHYLAPLPMTGDNATLFKECVAAVVDGDRPMDLIYKGEKLFGFGCEFNRSMATRVGGSDIQWTERIILVRSASMALREWETLKRRLGQAEEAISGLTPDRARGKRQFSEESALRGEIERILKQLGVTGLLEVTCRREEETCIRYIGRGRGGPNRPTQTEIRVRYTIDGIQRNEAAIWARRYRKGFRMYGTDLSADGFPMQNLILHYNGGYCIERDFHLLKDKPLGIRPFFVRKDNQITGLTHLLTLGLRVMTLIETQVRKGLADTNETLSGLYQGQPSLTTNRPTGIRLLKAFSRAQINLSRVEIAGQVHWHITPLSGLLVQILEFLGLSTSLYTRLTENSS